MADAFPKEFALAAACCRWPLSDSAVAAIQDAASGAVDWPLFMRIVKRHRIIGLVQNALQSAGIGVPPAQTQILAAGAQRIAWRNALFAAETVRLQNAFDAAQIPALVLKGAALAQQAYGTLRLKESKDIDLAVPAACVEQSLALMEREGYRISSAHAGFDDGQKNAVLRYGVEIGLRHRQNGVETELRWRLSENPWLFTAADYFSQTQDVDLPGLGSLRTLPPGMLFVYLCVHGATHGWSRLKWLADLNAFLSTCDEGVIEDYFRQARALGSDRCAAQALVLCERLFARPLPGRLAAELTGDRRVQRLAVMALEIMIGPRPEVDMHDRAFGTTRVAVMQFYLGRGWRYFFAQCRVLAILAGDVAEFPLPAPLHFLYPLLRLPLWAWRRAFRAGSGTARLRQD
jgi:hypothetical protein